jgi:GNAT superfamily N-acetyltransferase
MLFVAASDMPGQMKYFHADRGQGCMNIRTGGLQDIDLLIDIDNDASTLFERAGLRLDAERDREITLAARERWMKCLAAGTVLLSEDDTGRAVAFAAVGARDAEPYLDQLSVRMDSMGKGMGTVLLYEALKIATRSHGRVLWLTTYEHLSWNRPFYERHGFVSVAPEHCGEQLRGELSFERRLLPDPQHRIAMRRELSV